MNQEMDNNKSTINVIKEYSGIVAIILSSATFIYFKLQINKLIKDQEDIKQNVGKVLKEFEQKIYNNNTTMINKIRDIDNRIGYNNSKNVPSYTRYTEKVIEEDLNDEINAMN